MKLRTFLSFTAGMMSASALAFAVASFMAEPHIAWRCQATALILLVISYFWTHEAVRLEKEEKRPKGADKEKQKEIEGGYKFSTAHSAALRSKP